MKPQELGHVVRENIPLLTARLILRSLRPDDAGAVFEYAHDPEVTRYTTWDAHATVEESRRYIDKIIAGYQRGDNAELAIEHKADRKVIGACGLKAVSLEHCRGELVFAMAKQYWGSGLMAEALKATLAFAYGPLQLNRVFAKVDPDNMNTIRLLRRAGWMLEGCLRQDVRVRGQFRDVKLYSLLKGDFVKAPTV